MKHSPNRIPRPPREAILIFGAGVLLTLCTFFLRSFEDRFVLFFNDGPLGLLASDAMQAGSHGAGLLSGYWFNLNWLGAFSGHVISMISTMINAPHPTIMSVARWYFPASGLVLVSCAWFGFRRLGMPHPVAILGGFVLFLSGTIFTLGAWGLSSRLNMHGVVMVALGLLVGGDERRTWVRLVLGGMAVGLAVSEAGDVGAIFSIVVAAAVVADALSREGNRERSPWRRSAAEATEPHRVRAVGRLELRRAGVVREERAGHHQHVPHGADADRKSTRLNSSH